MLTSWAITVLRHLQEPLHLSPHTNKPKSTLAINGPKDQNCDQKMKTTEIKWPLTDTCCVSDTVGIWRGHLVSLVSPDKQLRLVHITIQPYIQEEKIRQPRETRLPEGDNRNPGLCSTFCLWAPPMDGRVAPGRKAGRTVDHSSYGSDVLQKVPCIRGEGWSSKLSCHLQFSTKEPILQAFWES